MNDLNEERVNGGSEATGEAASCVSENDARTIRTLPPFRRMARSATELPAIRAALAADASFRLPSPPVDPQPAGPTHPVSPVPTVASTAMRTIRSAEARLPDWLMGRLEPARSSIPSLRSHPETPGQERSQPPLATTAAAVVAAVAANVQPRPSPDAALAPPPSLASPPPARLVPADPGLIHSAVEAQPLPHLRPWRLLRITVKTLLALAALWLLAVVVALFAFRIFDPPFSTLTLARYITGAPVQQRWVPIAAISPRLQLAVIVSEDNRFCQHNGIDVTAIEAAVEQARDGSPRGASTISMQVVKNLFLWPSRSYVRKAIEIPLTLVMEQILSKRRILEIYLNVAEWGPGLFGADAAARYHFEKSPTRLTDAEAALLAVALPNPAVRDAGDPGPGTQRLARTIETRMRVAPRSVTNCLASGFNRTLSRR